MRVAVRASWVAFTAPLEGVVTHFYADVKGLVTIAIGNLVDPLPSALGLPMKRLDGTSASKAEVEADWRAVKENPNSARLGWRFARGLTKLRLTDAGVESLVMGKLASNDVLLRHRFPDFESWCADAQLATHSMAWACGPHFRFPRLEAALLREDFASAALECRMAEAGNPGLKPRNIANRLLYQNASYVGAEDMDREMLYFPVDLYAARAAREADTLRELPDVSDELGPEDETQPRLVPSRPPSSPPKDEPIVDFAIVHASPYQEPDDAA